MTVVTTSRKPVPEVRTLARDLAFSIGAGYVTRGKAGMGDLFALDESVLIVSKSGPFFLIQVYSGGEQTAEIRVASFTVEERAGPIASGLFVSDRPVYEAFKDHADVVFAGDSLAEHRIVFDGAQRRRYTLKVAP
ncbi:MAG: small nucleolar ribonucleoprotein [Euryarchaeota archaeon]|jgi:U3 small nucleolar ribonucleoprotein protein IMP4|nr:small nucleolar ribonucleoprotein [Euryarchaeota archaeon]MDN5339426.1 small nucleolar ribonucleoprotein [Euryarchaeota archaeon]